MPGVIVHEWLAPHGGSEKVVRSMLNTFPDAPLVALWNDAPGDFEDRPIKESWIARTPLRRSKAISLPFMPLTWSSMRFGDPDFVLISSHAFAHHADWRNRAHSPRFVYVHTPARYVWSPDLDARGSSTVARSVATLLKPIDRKAARQDAQFAANSEFVRERIGRAWGRDACVIYPPVQVARLQRGRWAESLSGGEEEVFCNLPSVFLLGASRFVTYKRLEKVIQAGEATDLPVVLAGDGPQRAELMARAEMASVPVKFVVTPSDRLLFALYEAAAAYVFLAVEDFGIMPVEAMALGTPVIVYGQGGAKESVLRLGGGAVVESLSRSDLRAGVELALSQDMGGVPDRALRIFGEDAFEARLAAWVADGDGVTNVIR